MMEQKDDPKTTETNNVVGRTVMTDEQLETLRKQIAVYRIISKQLFDTYKTLTATSHPQQDLALVTSGKTTILSSTSSRGLKSKRPRWNPTSAQLHILESIFSKASGLPSKQRIKEIAAELSSHGHVSETNVYNWFQNKRARSKRNNKSPLQTTTTSKTTPVLSKGDSDDDDSSEASKSKNDGDNNNTHHGGESQEKPITNNKTLMLPPESDEAPSCRIEDLSHEINAELLHFVNSRPPEVDSIFSNSLGGNNAH